MKKKAMFLFLVLMSVSFWNCRNNKTTQDTQKATQILEEEAQQETNEVQRDVTLEVVEYDTLKQDSLAIIKE